MAGPTQVLFSDAVWRPALEKYAQVTRLTVVVYGPERNIVSGPLHPTPLFALFEERGYEPGIFSECARLCLAQNVDRPAIVVAPTYGLAAVGTSLVLEGQVVGAAVAGYAFIDFCQASAVERLARDAGVPFIQIWSVARTTQPIPRNRLMLHGELLQVLGDAILRENQRTRQYEQAAAALTTAAAELTTAAAAKDEFLAIVSHELRTPLSPILLWAQALRRDPDPMRIERALAVIERNARIQARMVEDLVELSRTAQGRIDIDLEPRDLIGEVGLAVASMRETAHERSIDLQLVAGEDAVPVNVDSDRMQQVLTNVLSNALKFTPAGGSIVVTVRRDGDAGLVTTRDTGQGIAPEFLPFVFDMFRQEADGWRRGHAGLGIGLALVKRLVELHGGAITVSSPSVGKGTEVTIRLPLLTDAAVEQESSVTEPHLHSLAGLRVLVVEDAADVREAITSMLEVLGASACVADDGAMGLEVVARERPDLVLCDLRMPRMDGFEFIRQLHAAAGFRPRVIAMTGAGSGNDRKTRALGFNGQLDKPFGEQQLLRAVQAAMGASPQKPGPRTAPR